MSIKKIAELANTSPSTVSRVLNDPEHICHDPELAKRIWEIAGKLNYLPNSAARELRKGKTKQATSLTIDIFLTRFDSLDKDPFFLRIVSISSGCITEKPMLTWEYSQHRRYYETRIRFNSRYRPLQNNGTSAP